MISIITAIHNQLNVNIIFWNFINKYTKVKFELIIIDNNSTDGSKEFFKNKGAKVIENKDNYSYPYCQNQGIEHAKYETMVFLNNDIIVSKNWDIHLLEIMKLKKIDVCSISSQDSLESNSSTRKIRNRWKSIKNPLLFLFGQKKFNLLLMHKVMYGNWEKYTKKIYLKNKNKIFEGIAGSAVVVTKNGINKIGLWDERIQAADFDILLRTKKRNIEYNDILPAHVISGIYFHHYIRLTLKKTIKKNNNYSHFIDGKNIISIKEKWTQKYANELLKDTLVQI